MPRKREIDSKDRIVRQRKNRPYVSKCLKCRKVWEGWFPACPHCGKQWGWVWILNPKAPSQ